MMFGVVEKVKEDELIVFFDDGFLSFTDTILMSQCTHIRHLTNQSSLQSTVDDSLLESKIRSSQSFTVFFNPNFGMSVTSYEDHDDNNNHVDDKCCHHDKMDCDDDDLPYLVVSDDEDDHPTSRLLTTHVKPC